MVSGLPPFLANSTLPQWIIALSTGGTFVAVLRFVIQWRGQSLGSDKQFRADIAEEQKRLRDRLDIKDENFLKLEAHWREMLEASDRRHDECEEARRLLRNELDNLHAEIRGLHVQIRQASTDKLLIIEGNGDRPKPSKIAPEAAASAQREKRGRESDQ